MKFLLFGCQEFRLVLLKEVNSVSLKLSSYYSLISYLYP